MTSRRFSPKQRETIFRRTHGYCHICDLPIMPWTSWEVSHIIPLAIGGSDDLDNLAPAHARPCHAERTAKLDAPRIAKTKRQRNKHIGTDGPGLSARPMPCGRRSKLSKTIGHGIVDRLTQSEKHRRLMAEKFQRP